MSNSRKMEVQEGAEGKEKDKHRDTENTEGYREKI